MAFWRLTSFSVFFSAVTAVTYKVTSREVTSRDREVTSRDREAQPKLLAPKFVTTCRKLETIDSIDASGIIEITARFWASVVLSRAQSPFFLKLAQMATPFL